MLESPKYLRDIAFVIDDLFTDVLRMARAQPRVSGGFTAGGEWAIQFPPPEGIKFFGLIKGQCWLALEGADTPVRVNAGDVFLVCTSRPYVLASDLRMPPVDALGLFVGEGYKTATLGDGTDCIQVGGHVRLDAVNGGLLTDVLPPLIHVQETMPEAAILQWLVTQLGRECADKRLGARVAAEQLAQLIFVQIMRVYVETHGDSLTGWLRAINDKRLAPALQLMHGDPSQNWRLDQLAHAVAMSRTSFAHHFKEVAGVAPLTYLTQWRMRLATQALRDGGSQVAEISRSLGYTSESAFSNAFKRVIGQAPRQYRSAMADQSPAQ
ncbi:MAG: AraC family transcriptional regulator [Rhodanobacter sp.]